MSENTLFAFTDVDGDLLAAFTADIPDVGKGINVRTTEDGCSLPDEDAVKLATAILRKVVGPVYASPEELAAEINLEAIRARERSASQEVYRLCEGGRFTMTVPPREDTDSDTVIIASLSDISTLLAEVVRLREESALAYSQGVEDMREKAVEMVRNDLSAPFDVVMGTAIRDLTLTGPTTDTTKVVDGIGRVRRTDPATETDDGTFSCGPHCGCGGPSAATAPRAAFTAEDDG